MTWFYCFFLVSGFCGILYELIWLRLAMAQFAVTTAFVSILLSAFMGELASDHGVQAATPRSSAAATD